MAVFYLSVYLADFLIFLLYLQLASICYRPEL